METRFAPTMCDGRIQLLAHAADGRAARARNVTRVIPHYLRRVVLARDGGRCVVDGCSNKRWLQLHHVEHLAHGGATDEDNLRTICPFHHRYLHEGGRRLRRTSDGRWIFARAARARSP